MSFGGFVLVLGANANAVVFDGNECQSAFLKRPPKLRFRRAVNLVAVAFVIPDRAAGHAGAIRQIALRPIEEAAACATERR